MAFNAMYKNIACRMMCFTFVPHFRNILVCFARLGSLLDFSELLNAWTGRYLAKLLTIILLTSSATSYILFYR